MPDTTEQVPERSQRELSALIEIAKIITSPAPLPDLLQAIMNGIIGVMEPAQIGAVMLWDEAEGLFRAAASFGYDIDVLREIAIQKGEAITGKAFEYDQIMFLASPAEVESAMSDMNPDNKAILAKSLDTKNLPECTIASPLSVGNKKFGILILETLNGTVRLTEQDLPFIVTLSELIALAIDRSHLLSISEAKREAQEADKMRSELMAALSHELRLPLTAIKGYSSALLLEDVNWNIEKQKEFLRFIEEECDNMQVILTDILDPALVDVDQLSMEPQPLRLDRVARSIAEDMQRRTDIHNLLVDFPSDFPIVDADPHWIRQVFRNGIDNAIKYSPDGGLIVIRGEMTEKNILISIADQGIGIAPADMIQLFDKYNRIANYDSLKVSGFGLGLPIARALIEAHGGQIWAESKIGQGTTLRFTIPTREINIFNSG